MTIGLSGSHRTGKTTLAKAYAERQGITFLETSASAVFRELGLDPAVTYDFATRLTVQEKILERFDAQFAAMPAGSAWIADRTPLDLLGYTMAEAIGETVSEEDQKRFAIYTQRCFDCINKRFSVLIVVQPGIQLVAADGKAVVNVAYIEHLNSLIMGLSVDERIKIPHFYIRRSVVDLQERIDNLENATMKVMRQLRDEVIEYRAVGNEFQ